MVLSLEVIKQNLFKAMSEQKVPLVYLGEEDGDHPLKVSSAYPTYSVKSINISFNNYISCEFDKTNRLIFKTNNPNIIYSWIVCYKEPEIKYNLYFMSFDEGKKTISLLTYGETI